MGAFDDLDSNDAVADQRRSDFHHDTLEGETNGRQDQCSNIDCRIFRDRLHNGGCTAMTDDNDPMEAGTLFLTIVTGSLLISVALILLIGIQP
jgi:hypothetical protein